MSDRGVRFCAGRGSSSAIFRAKVADILDEFVAISDCVGSFQCSGLVLAGPNLAQCQRDQQGA